MIRVYQEADYAAMSRRAAHIIAAEIHRNPACVLGLATGSTPIGAYENLVAWTKSGDLSFKEVQTVNLDEYKGLAPTHDQSYRYFMNTNLFDHVDIDPSKTHVPNGLAADADAECAQYDELVASLGYADLQLLGIGHNGHIGFNEPDDHYTKETHVVDLTQSTIDANARFFASRDDVPRYAVTMGVGDIMRAKRLLLIINGNKEDAASQLLLGDRITPRCPVTLMKIHPDATVLIDRALADKIGYKG